MAEHPLTHARTRTVIFASAALMNRSLQKGVWYALLLPAGVGMLETVKN
jgi:hypothetical protein